mgnify:FL=1
MAKMPEMAGKPLKREVQRIVMAAIARSLTEGGDPTDYFDAQDVDYMGLLKECRPKIICNCGKPLAPRYAAGLWTWLCSKCGERGTKRAATRPELLLLAFLRKRK